MKANAICKTCEIKFYTRPSFLKIGWGKYCSKPCQYLGLMTGEHFKCYVCNKTDYRAHAKLSHSKSGKFFCSKSCQTKWRNRQFIGPLHRNWKGGISTYRDILSKSKPLGFCILCKTKDKRVLAAHHIDGNHRNNVATNLTWLCHNCHNLVHCDNLEWKRLADRLSAS